MDIQVLASSSSGNCYYVSDSKTPLLLECGIPFKEIQRCLDFQTSSIAGVLLTHEHSDHAKAARDVLRAGLDIYASQGTTDALGLKSHRMHPIQAKKQFGIGSWTILPFDVKHDAAEPLGFLLASGTEKLLYITDTYYCRYKFSGLTHIMIEANHSYDILRANVESGIISAEHKNRLIRSHFSLENVKEFFKANDLSRVREIHLIHLSGDNSDAQRFKREIAGLTGKPTYIAGG